MTEDKKNIGKPETAEESPAIENRDLTTEEDIPTFEGLRTLAGPLTTPLPPEHIYDEALLERIVGWDGVKYSINLIRTKLANAPEPESIKPGNYLFIGNPGTGKTLAALFLGSLMRDAHVLKQGCVITRTAAEMCSQLEDFDKIIAMAKNNVLFIDEAHQLGDPNIPHGREVLRRLIAVLEDPDVKKDTCIILAGYPREMYALLEVDPGLRSRFDEEESKVFFRD